MVKCKDQEGDSRVEAISSRASEVDEAEVEEMQETVSSAISAGDWDTQLRVVPCVFKVNSRSNTEEAQEASHGGHPEQAGVVLAIEDEDRHGQPQ